MFSYGRDSRKASASFFVLLFIMGTLVGGLGSYFVNTRQVTSLTTQVDSLQSKVTTLSFHQNQTVNNQTITLYQNGTSIVEIYEKASPSVVLIRGTTDEGDVHWQTGGVN
jgi:hypothetical protein